MMPIGRPSLPLAAWAALVALLVGLVTLGAGVVGGPLAAGGVVLAAVMGCAALGSWFGRRLEAVRTRALAQLADGTSNPTAAAPRELRELRRLDDALVALRLRIQLADEVADQHRRAADSAGTGMFELLSGLVAAEEGTRGQLAAELHDTVAQSLGAARRMLSDPPDPAGSAALWDDIAPLVEEAEDALRATMARTRPPALREGNLAVAVTQFRDDLEMRYGLHVALEWPIVEYPLPLATAVTIYRFFQEALLNVLKHADVDEAVASLSIDGRQLTAVVRDSGPGFDLANQPVAGSGGRHVGLGLLRERARLAGGSVDVMSAPGAGTMLTLRLPLPAAPEGWSEPVSAPGSSVRPRLPLEARQPSSS
jgi:signal transduction histidine kinase